MKQTNTPIRTIDEYIHLQDKDKQAGLQKLRAIIQKAAPKSSECISYSMPAFQQNGVLVYFAVTKTHYGFYPTANPIVVFKKQLDEKGYTYSKGAIQLPLDKPFPVKLIQDMVKLRIQENELKAKLKIKKAPKK
ncbi:MAG: hypothetical protein RLZ56_1191 [Bacteroidota bacterium]|jgi:uncharacterized protein YdhG (YjbR/CyaY superfamily)